MNKETFEEAYPITHDIEQIMARCAEEDVPTDVFKSVCALYSKSLMTESDARFNKVEKFILRLFKRI